MLIQDFGALYSETHTTLSTSYRFGAYKGAAGVNQLRCVVKIVAANGSTIGNVTVKLQGSYDGTDVAAHPCELASVRDDNATAELEHVFAPTTNATVYYAFHVDPSAFKAGIRAAVKTAGAAVSGDSVTVYAMGMRI